MWAGLVCAWAGSRQQCVTCADKSTASTGAGSKVHKEKHITCIFLTIPIPLLAVTAYIILIKI